MFAQVSCGMSGGAPTRGPASYHRPMAEIPVRRVVTGITDGGVHTITDDGLAPNTHWGGPFGVSEVFWSERSPRHIGDTIDRGGKGFPLEPPAGGASGRVIRMPGIPDGVDPDSTWLRVDGDDPEVPGMHATDTLDLMVVLEGRVVLGLDDGEYELGPGEFVVQRGTRHRWRPADGGGWTYFVAMLRPDASVTTDPIDVRVATTGDRPVHRIVTGDPALIGGASDAREVGGTTITDIWHTGGPLRDATQGGDPDGQWTLEPVVGGAWCRLVELTPAPPDENGWHTTATIDIDVVLSGRVRLELPDGVSTELSVGDVVIQRGTEHRWVALGDETFRMATVMFDAEVP